MNFPPTAPGSWNPNGGPAPGYGSGNYGYGNYRADGGQASGFGHQPPAGNEYAGYQGFDRAPTTQGNNRDFGRGQAPTNSGPDHHDHHRDWGQGLAPTHPGSDHRGYNGDHAHGHAPANPDARGRDSHHRSSHRRTKDPKLLLEEVMKNLSAKEASEIIAKNSAWEKELVGESLGTMAPETFKSIWASAPRGIRAAVWDPPPDLDPNFREIKDPDVKKKTCMALNALRRERCLPLAPDTDKWFWGAESWVVVPMSSNTKNHFWDIKRKLPIFTSDPSKWKDVLEFLKKSPHGPEPKTNISRHLDVHDRTGLKGDQSPSTDVVHAPPGHWRTNSRSRSPRRRAHPTAPSPRGGRRASPRAHHSPLGSVLASPPPEGGRQRQRSPSAMLPGAGKLPIKLGSSSQLRGLDALKSLAACSPPGAKGKYDDASELADFVYNRVRIDTAELSAENLEIDRMNRLPRKMTPSKALLSVATGDSEAFKATFEIYHRKLKDIFDRIPDRKCKQWQAIKKLCEILNIELPERAKYQDLVTLFARLRTNDMTRKSF